MSQKEPKENEKLPSQNNEEKQSCTSNTSNNDIRIQSPDKKRIKQSSPPPSKAIQIQPQPEQDGPSNFNEAAANSPSSSRSLDKTIPLWVAGSSPAKFVSLQDLIKMNDSIEKMAIVHQIAVDPKCTVEDLKQRDPLYEQVKSSMHRAYWDLLRDDLGREPPNNEHAFTLLRDLKKMITEHLETGNLKNALSAVDEALDLDHLRQMLQRGVLNFREVLHSVLAILERLCAPVRDELVAVLKQEADIVELFRGIFNLVEQMQLDMANFTLSQNRQLIGTYSAKIEFDEFIKLSEIDPTVADNTKSWLQQILQDFLASKEPTEIGDELTRADVNELIVQFYIALLMGQTAPKNNKMLQFPETIKLDAQRIEALGEKLLQLELTMAAVFVSSNMVGKAVCEGKAQFKPELKRDLLVILNDLDSTNYMTKLDNVALQCDKKCREVVGEQGWTEEHSSMLKQQLLAFANTEESVRTISRNRIRDFICQVLRQTSAPLRIPPGLSVCQTELASLTSRFYAIAVHNWSAFGRFYGQILEEQFQQWRSARKCETK